MRNSKVVPYILGEAGNLRKTELVRLLNNREKREILRQKGQFWTPDWVAEAMVAYVLGGGSD